MEGLGVGNNGLSVVVVVGGGGGDEVVLIALRFNFFTV